MHSTLGAITCNIELLHVFK